MQIKLNKRGSLFKIPYLTMFNSGLNFEDRFLGGSFSRQLHRKPKILYTLFALIFLTSFGFATAHADGVAQVVLAGAGTVAFDGNTNHCGTYDFVDAPARAFRDQSNVVHLFISGDHNRQFTGPSLLEARYSCAIGLKGGHNSNPAAYDDYSWLTAFHTDDGILIRAFIHNEFHGSEWPKLCANPKSLGCWETDITAAISNDKGYHFKRVAAPKGLIAVLPYQYNSSRVTQAGFFNPTNIISLDKYYYTFIPMIDPVDHTGGVCLLRTTNIADPKAWLGWDGSGFKASFVDPYTVNIKTPKVHLCQPVEKGKLLFGIGSISRYMSSGKFVAVMRFNRWDKPLYNEIPGVYTSVSTDLLHWSVPLLLLSDGQARRSEMVEDPIEYYPSLLDPNSPDRNFEQITDKPLLFTVEIIKGKNNHERKLMKWPVQLHLK